MENKKYLYALDLAMGNTGVAIFDLDTGDLIKVTSISTAITNKTGLKKNPNHNNPNMIMGIKLKHIQDKFNELRESYPPEKVIIEEGFTRFNKSTQVVFRVHGIAHLTFYDVENIYYTSTNVKKFIFNDGKASKEDLSKIITKRLGYTFANEDESDAVALGLTYFIKNNIIKWKINAETPTKKKKKNKTKKEES